MQEANYLGVFDSSSSSESEDWEDYDDWGDNQRTPLDPKA